MTAIAEESARQLLIQSLPRGLVMGIEEALLAGAQRAFNTATGMHEGHLPHVVGQLRHFFMNESFHRALEIGGASPTAIRGNGIVTGRAGMFTLARLNIPQHFWINGRRSYTRRQLSAANQAIAQLLQPELFDQFVPPNEGTAFFVACFSGKLSYKPDAPLSVQIAVPAPGMRRWIFREPLQNFVESYDRDVSRQVDLAKPTLKKGLVKRENGAA